MACKECERTGKTKIIHFERCGRWETRIYCKHTYKKGALNENQTKHVLSKHDIDPVKKGTRQKPKRHHERHSYTEEQDQFILQNYSTQANRYNHRGDRLMQKMLDAFQEKFGWRPTPSAMVGRYGRLAKKEPEKVEEVRGVPSLPVLKFMAGATS